MTRGSNAGDVVSTGERVSAALATDEEAADVVEAAGHFRIYLGAAAGVGKPTRCLAKASAAAGGAPT